MRTIVSAALAAAWVAGAIVTATAQECETVPEPGAAKTLALVMLLGCIAARRERA